jgi:hypothetical protein
MRLPGISSLYWETRSHASVRNVLTPRWETFSRLGERRSHTSVRDILTPRWETFSRLGERRSHASVRDILTPRWETFPWLCRWDTRNGVIWNHCILINELLQFYLKRIFEKRRSQDKFEIRICMKINDTLAKQTTRHIEGVQKGGNNTRIAESPQGLKFE